MNFMFEFHSLSRSENEIYLSSYISCKTDILAAADILPFVPHIVKNTFAYSSDTLFQLSVIYKLYRQVLTPINNSQLLLNLEILDKLRLAQHKQTATL